MKKYTFGIKKNNGLGYEGVILADKTCIIKTKTGLLISFPKKKFAKDFKRQIENESKYIGVMFSPTEIKAIQLGFKKLGEMKDGTK